MATTNLNTKTIGDVNLQSGNGSPDHVALKGSLYTDIDTSTLYQNVDGNTSWISYNSVSYGEGFYQDNTSPLTVSSQNTWYLVPNNLTGGSLSGFTTTNNSLVLNSGYDGLYNITMSVTIQNSNGLGSFDCGVSKNDTVPQQGSYNTGTVDGTFIYDNISVNFDDNLVGGDTLKIAVRNITGASNIIIRSAQLIIYKIG